MQETNIPMRITSIQNCGLATTAEALFQRNAGIKTPQRPARVSVSTEARWTFLCIVYFTYLYLYRVFFGFCIVVVPSTLTGTIFTVCSDLLLQSIRRGRISRVGPLVVRKSRERRGKIVTKLSQEKQKKAICILAC